MWDGRTRGNRLKQADIQTGYKEIIFTLRTVKKWHSLLKEVVLSSSIEVQKTRLNKPLSNQI